MRIRIREQFDLGSGINIPDTQHCSRKSNIPYIQLG